MWIYPVKQRKFILIILLTVLPDIAKLYQVQQQMHY